MSVISPEWLIKIGCISSLVSPHIVMLRSVRSYMQHVFPSRLCQDQKIWRPNIRTEELLHVSPSAATSILQIKRDPLTFNEFVGTTAWYCVIQEMNILTISFAL